MNKLIIITVLLFNMSCTKSKQETATFQPKLIAQNVSDVNTDDHYTITNKDYVLDFKVEKVDNQHAFLVVDVKLKNNSWYASPKDPRDLKGKFTLDFGSYKDITFKGSIIDNPPFNADEINPAPEKEAIQFKNAVHINTTYRQPLKILTNGDFEVFGRVRFTIEPRCTFEEHPILIKYLSGKFKFGEPKC